MLLYAAFPPLDWGLLGWVALAPLLIALRGVPPRRAFVLGGVSGLVAYVGILSWMRVFGVVPWLLLAAYLSLYPGVFAVLWRWIGDGRAPWVGVWSAPLLWSALEYLRSTGVMGFPWALLGLTQWRWPVVIQVASATGVYGLSFFLALVSAAVALAVGRRTVRPLLLPALLVAAVILWGHRHLPPPTAGDLRVAALQPNVPAREKFDPFAAPQHMDRLRTMVEEAGRRGAALVVMPETAVPYNLFGRDGVLREVGGWAARASATMIAGSLEDGISNIAVAIAPSGEAVSRYDKVRLVAFGEYGIRPGRGHDPLRTPLGPVGVAICFESIFPDVSRAFVRHGAEVLAVITNDGWFDGTSGVAQHAAHAVFRAVETGRWVVRAANTGLTMVVDPAGRIRARISPGIPAVLTDAVALAAGETPYTRAGDLFACVALLATAVVSFPRLRAILRPDLHGPAFGRAAAAVGLPLATVWLLVGARPEGVWPGVLLVFVIFLSTRRPLREWGVTVRGFLPALGAGLAVVGLLWMTLVLAFRAYDLPLAAPGAPDGRATLIVRQALVALAIEGWARGVAFVPVAEWLGRPTAAAVGAAAGMLLQRGLGAEAIAWAMITGAAFGLIRARTGNVAGLVVPHLLGNILFSVVAPVR
ncbi:MAG: apolipoprotein N-acyltransferase [Armatimonadota bacterium]|nr:apolipoprotein N-acyltransferase [Armatimonadota bacterium]MDR7451290.1 apolipoprotein N-acyltransferase [Armatimonadota bacterium]MDR7466807.1 apolipoprotein N-acyltransferase [Armatimonadota bacterium]MDR7492720.1 apolipoprotein N-acyltransferase [Armatimonadota bacterium]MDR7499649.1 apolipoprotein N-acyltransferase [Armatimonadota bacterium]